MNHTTLSDWGVVAVLGLVAAVLFQTYFSDEEPRQFYVSDPLLEPAGAVPDASTPEAYAAYQWFVEQAGYFGAFAVGPEDTHGWSDNFASQHHADVAALEWCGGVDAGCRIVARLRPAAPSHLNGQPLSFTQAQALEEFQDWRGFKAIAMSDEGDWGAAYNHASPDAARKEALANCRAYLLDNPPPGVPAGECRLISMP